MPTINAITLSNVGFYRDHTPIFEGVNAQIRRGSYTGLIGPNGSGKSTLLQIILGLLQPTKGRVQLFGQTAVAARQHRVIRFVAQRSGRIDPLFPATVSEIIRSGALSAHPRVLSVEQALALVDLTELADRPLQQLSGGERQRALLARAFITPPDLLCLDEPTDGLDPQTREIFYRILKELHKQGSTILLISHDVDRLADEVETAICLNHEELCTHEGSCVVNAGRLQAVVHSTPDQIRRGHRMPHHHHP